MTRHLTFVLLVPLLTSVACFGGDDEPASTPAPQPAMATVFLEASPSETPAPTATTAPSATGCPGAPEDHVPTRTEPLTIWLIDATTGDVATLHERCGVQWAWTQFSDDGSHALVQDHLPDAPQLIEFNLDGVEAGRSPLTLPCTYGSIEIDGYLHAQVECEEGWETLAASQVLPSLPKGSAWYTYSVSTAPTVAPFSPPDYDVWALNVVTGERRLLQAGLQHCGGCDAGSGAPGLSPSGRYVAFGENGPKQRIFLHDFEAATTVELTREDGSPVQSAEWSPLGDYLLRPTLTGVAIDDLDAGTSLAIDKVAWPASFDQTGRLIYSPGYFGGSRPNLGDTLGPTLVADAQNGKILSEVSGVPAFLNFWREIYPVAVTVSGEVLAALEFAEGCAGIAIYRGQQRIACVVRSEGASFSPDGSMVALVRVTSPPSQSLGPYDNVREFEIVIFDMGAGTERVVAQEAYGRQPPLIVWNKDSVHLLVRWPTWSGL